MTENSFSICPGLSVMDSQSLQSSLLSSSSSLAWSPSLILTVPSYIPSLSWGRRWELESYPPYVFWLDTVNKRHLSEFWKVTEIMDSGILYHLWNLLKIKNIGLESSWTHWFWLVCNYFKISWMWSPNHFFTSPTLVLLSIVWACSSCIKSREWLQNLIKISSGFYFFLLKAWLIHHSSFFMLCSIQETDFISQSNSFD